MMQNIQKQQGLALYLALVMLISIAVVGVASSRSSINALASSNNLQAYSMVEVASNSILSATEDLLLQSVTSADAGDGAQGLAANQATEYTGATFCFDGSEQAVFSDGTVSCGSYGWGRESLSLVDIPQVRAVAKRDGNCNNAALYSVGDGQVRLAEVFVMVTTQARLGEFDLRQEQKLRMKANIDTSETCADETAGA